MIVFVSCCNDNQVVNEMLMPSLLATESRGQIDFKAILIDTTNKKYPSAAKAFNIEVNNASLDEDDVIVFLHQDVAWDNDTQWKRVLDELSHDSNQILGFAGMSKTMGRTISNVKDQGNGEYATLTRVKDKTCVESLDECCFALKFELFKKLKFDEAVCYHWHLYAVELCYRARIEYNTSIYVLPESIYHKKTIDGVLTGGSMYSDKYFLNTLCRMIKKYKSKVSVIYTPCLICPTSFWGSRKRIWRSRLKNLIRH